MFWWPLLVLLLWSWVDLTLMASCHLNSSSFLLHLTNKSRNTLFSFINLSTLWWTLCQLLVQTISSLCYSRIHPFNRSPQLIAPLFYSLTVHHCLDWRGTWTCIKSLRVYIPRTRCKSSYKHTSNCFSNRTLIRVFPYFSYFNSAVNVVNVIITKNLIDTTKLYNKLTIVYFLRECNITKWFYLTLLHWDSMSIVEFSSITLIKQLLKAIIDLNHH